MIDDVMHVIIPSSSHYVPYLAVLLTSILCNKNDEDKLYFHIMSEDITEDDKMRLEEVRKFGDFDIEYVEMNPDDIKDVPVCKEFYINNLCNYKMKIASIFKDIKKALVLEVDMIVQSSFRELFDYDMGESAFAAVKDPWCEEFQEIFDIPKKYRYCNTGMFLANLELWRKKNYEQKMFENIKRYSSKLIYPDQDIFNRTFYLETVYLPQKWNVYSNVPYTHEDEKEEAFKDAANGSGLIHYAADKKPWLYAEDCTFSSIWWNYARKLSFYELILERMLKNSVKLEHNEEALNLKQKSPRISIIVPVYNPPEEYFTYCLYSLLNQTLSDIEIILIDNESTGNNSDIIKRFASLDSRIKVFKFEKNCGFAKACNKGLEIASGEYVFIVDSDDYITPDACEKAYNRAVKDNLDVLIFANYVNDCRKNIISSTVIQNYDLDVSSFTFSPDTSWLLNLYMTVWNKLFRRDFLLKNNLCFDTRLSVAAPDVCLSLKSYILADKINYLNEPLYYYRINLPNNVMAKLSKKGEKLYHQVFSFCNIIDDFIKKYDIKPEIIPYMIKVNLDILTLNFDLTDKSNKKDFYNKMHEYFNNCDKTVYSKSNLKLIGYYQFFKSVLNNSYYTFKLKNMILAFEENYSHKRIRLFGISIYKRTRDESHKSYKILGIIRFKKKLKKGGNGGV